MTLPAHFVFSQSSLASYERCPRQFHLRYVLRQPWPAPEFKPVQTAEAHRLAGVRFHRLAQQAALGLPLDLLSAQAEAQGEPIIFWWKHFIAAFEPLLTRRGATILHPEISLGARIGAHRLTAKIDLLALSPQQWTIYDWKTEARLPRQATLRHRWQTRLYLALLAHNAPHLNQGNLFPPEKIRMVYWYANYPDTPLSFPYTKAQYKADLRAVSALMTQIEQAETFPPTENEKICRYCPYRSYCGRGVQAGNWESAEEMPAEEEQLASLDFEQIAESAF